MKILIVDDEKIILEKLKMYISQIFTEKENIFLLTMQQKHWRSYPLSNQISFLRISVCQEKTACIFSFR